MFYDCFTEGKHEESEWLSVLSFEISVVGVVMMFAKSGSWPTERNSLVETIAKNILRNPSFPSEFPCPISEDLFMVLLKKEADQILHWLSTSDIQKMQRGPEMNLDVFTRCVKKSEPFRRACRGGFVNPENTLLYLKPPESREEFLQGLNMLTGQNSNRDINPNGCWTTWARKDPLWVVELADRMKAMSRDFIDSGDAYNLVAAFARATSAKCVYVTSEEAKENAYRRMVFGVSCSGLLLLPLDASRQQSEDSLFQDAYKLLQKYLEWWDSRDSLSEMARGKAGIQAIPSERTLDELAENRVWERDVALFLRFGIYGIPALLTKFREHDNGLIFTLLLEIIHDASYSDILKEVEDRLLSQRIEQTRSHGRSDTPKPVPAETWLTPVSKVITRYPDYDSRTKIIHGWWKDYRHTYANLPNLQSEIDETIREI